MHVQERVIFLNSFLAKGAIAHSPQVSHVWPRVSVRIQQCAAATCTSISDGIKPHRFARTKNWKAIAAPRRAVMDTASSSNEGPA